MSVVTDTQNNIEEALETAHEAHSELIHGADNETFDVAMATVVGNRIDGDALATFIVGPAASGKTEIVTAVKDYRTTEFISEMTPATLASGYDPDDPTAHPDDPSLLVRMARAGQSTLLFKEFNSILSGSDAGEIIGQLRDVLDGTHYKQFGNNRRVAWDGTIGMLAGVTPNIEREWSTVTSMGDRWIFIRLDVTKDRMAVALAAQSRVGNETQLRARFWAASAELLDLVGIPDLDLIDCPSEHSFNVARAAEFLSRARTSFGKDSDEIVYLPEPEGPARLSKSLFKLVKCLAAVRGRNVVTAVDVATIFRMVRDTMPSVRRTVFEALTETPVPFGTVEELTQLSPSSLRRHLNELRLLKLAVASTDQSGNRGRPGQSWSLSLDADNQAPWR